MQRFFLSRRPVAKVAVCKNSLLHPSSNSAERSGGSRLGWDGLGLYIGFWSESVIIGQSVLESPRV